MKKKLLLIVCLFLFINNLYSKNIFNFAFHLYENNDYYRAISEFNRFLFYYPNSKKRNEAYLYIVKSYYNAQQYNQAVSEVNNLIKNIKKKFYKENMDLILAKSYLYLEQFSFASKIFNSLKENGLSKQIKQKSDYGLIWLQIFKNDWEKADEKLGYFIKTYPESSLKEEAFLLKDDIKQGINFFPLSPTWAGIMSAVLPGSGQIYCKRIGDGLVAFTFISLLSYGVYYYHKNGPDEMFYGFAVLDFIFYLGNIYTAFGSAHKYNRNFNQQLRNRLINSYNY